MNKYPKISIIVAVYKAEKYLKTCINSLLNQSFPDFEILLINDGSPDSSGEICDEYAKKDSRIRVFHKINGGVSSARQCGIENALGEYSIHVDPDDWVEPKMLEELYTKAQKDNADMVICDFYKDSLRTNKVEYVKQKPSNLEHNIVLKELFQHLHGSCCNKLVKHICYKKYNIIYPLELTFCEDLYVNASLLMNPLKISYLSKAFYHYVYDINENSLVSYYTNKSFEHDILKKNMFCQLLKTNSCISICENSMIFNLVHRAFLGNVFTSLEFKHKLYNYRKHIISNRNYSIKFRLILYFSCIGFYKPIYKIFKFLKKLSNNNYDT